MDPFESYSRLVRYIGYGVTLGAVAGAAGGVFLAEYFYDYSPVMQKSLDVAVGIMGAGIGGVTGGICGKIFSYFVNSLMSNGENISFGQDKKKDDKDS